MIENSDKNKKLYLVTLLDGVCGYTDHITVVRAHNIREAEILSGIREGFKPGDPDLQKIHIKELCTKGRSQKLFDFYNEDSEM